MTHQVYFDRHGITTAGEIRDTNADQFLIADLNKSVLIQQTSLSLDDGSRWFGGSQGSLMLVADGMGGHAGGERASTIAVDRVVLFTLNTMPWFYRLEAENDEDLRGELTAALEKCQESIRAEAEAIPERMGMGTTLTMAYTLWPRFYVVHVGDSRGYLLRGSRLEQITTDHTIAQKLVDSGSLKASKAEDSPMSSVLWNTIGGSSSDLTAEIHKGHLELGDTMLLCTDGLTRHVKDKEIKKILKRAESAESACKALVEAANEDGGSDNITVVVARYSTAEAEAELNAHAKAEDHEPTSSVGLPAEQAPPQQAGGIALDS